MCNKFLVVDHNAPSQTAKGNLGEKNRTPKTQNPIDNLIKSTLMQLLPGIYDCLRYEDLLYFHLKNLTFSLTKFIFRFIPAKPTLRPPGQGHLGISSWRPCCFLGGKPIFSHSKKRGEAKNEGIKNHPAFLFLKKSESLEF